MNGYLSFSSFSAACLAARILTNTQSLAEPWKTKNVPMKLKLDDHIQL